jgi:hypothetical protein
VTPRDLTPGSDSRCHSRRRRPMISERPIRLLQHRASDDSLRIVETHVCPTHLYCLTNASSIFALAKKSEEVRYTAGAFSCIPSIVLGWWSEEGAGVLAYGAMKPLQKIIH